MYGFKESPYMTTPKKLVFCTYSSLYSSIILKKLLECPDIHVVGIVNSTRNYKRRFSTLRSSLYYIRDTGWLYAVYLFFITDIHRLSQFIGQKQSIHTLAKTHHIPLLDTADINDQAGQQFVVSLDTDYLLSAHFNQLFKTNILTLPAIAALNIHPSLLPAYRGVDPVFYAMLHDEKHLGVSLHLLDEQFDTGHIASQAKIIRDPQHSLLANNSELFTLGVMQAIQYIRLDTQNAEKQQGDGHYDSWPTPQRVKQFSKTQKKLLRWADIKKIIYQTKL